MYPNNVHDFGSIQDSASGAGKRLNPCPMKYLTIEVG